MKNIDIYNIRKYVNGEDIEGYTLEELENNAEFMKSVISYTNDYKMYSLCSNEAKKNYELVKYLVLKFKDNTDFVTTVADYFLENSNDELEIMELSIIMEKILPKDLGLKYSIINRTSYSYNQFLSESVLDKDDPSDRKLGMGFILLFHEFKSSNYIMDYFASSMLDTIINDNNIDFEIMLHTQFKSVDRIEEVGINNYIISLVGCYDSMLSSYLSTHLDLIKPYVNEIKKVVDNWDLYLSNDEDDRYNNMLDMVHEYMDNSDSHFSETEILEYIANELGILEKVRDYTGGNDLRETMEDEFGFYDDTDLDEFSNDMVKLEIDTNPKERLTYLKVKRIIINQLFSDKPSDLDSIITENKKEPKKNVKCKMLQFKPNDNK